MRGLRRVRELRGRQPRVPGYPRAPAPGAGVRGDRLLGRRPDPPAQGHGTGRGHLRSAGDRWPARHLRGRAHALLHRRSEEHTSELQSHVNLVCRLLLEKKKKVNIHFIFLKKKKKKQQKQKKKY